MAPYWIQSCPLCSGYIADSLLECVGPAKYNTPEAKLLRLEKPGAALACPYCSGLIGFDPQGKLTAAQIGWPVLRYSRDEIRKKMTGEDGLPPQTPLPEWALRCRFNAPGTHQHWKVTHMLKTHQPMKLSHKEELFLKHWMNDEFHRRGRTGPAKRLQLEHPVTPAELAEIIGAWMPDTKEQAQIFEGVPPADPPVWPWASRQEIEELLTRARETVEMKTAAHR